MLSLLSRRPSPILIEALRPNPGAAVPWDERYHRESHSALVQRVRSASTRLRDPAAGLGGAGIPDPYGGSPAGLARCRGRRSPRCPAGAPEIPPDGDAIARGAARRTRNE